MRIRKEIIAAIWNRAMVTGLVAGALSVLVMVFVLRSVALADTTAEQTFTGSGVLIGTFAYPDGGAVDVTLDGNTAQFLAILPDGMTQASPPIILSCAATRTTARANGRTVHFVAEGACGVYHWRWEIPEQMRGLGGAQIFAPMVGG